MSLKGTRTRQAIERAAITLFAQRGPSEVSMRDIAKELGMQQSSLYNHWTDRQTLIRSLFQSGYGLYADQMLKASNDQTTSWKKVEACLSVVCALHEADQHLFDFLLMHQHVGLQAVSLQEGNPVEVLFHIIQQGIQNKDFLPEDPTMLTMAVIGVVVQAATAFHYHRTPLSLSQQKPTITAICKRILGS